MHLRSLCLIALLAAWPAGASGPADSVTGEIEALKKRVAELESQNRRMAEQLERLEALLKPAQPASPSAAVVPAPAKSVVQPAVPVRTAQSADNNKAGNGEAAPSLKFYGMMRLDIDIDTQRPNSPQAPLFISSPSSGDGGSFAMHPRLTRFGVDITGPRVSALGGAALSGKLETDFENGGSESRQIIRIRHAYFLPVWVLRGRSVLNGY